MSSKKQQRKAVERAKYQAYLERKAAQHRRHRRNQLIIGAVVIVAVIAGAIVWSTGVFSDDAVTAAPSASPTPTDSPSPAPSFKKAKQVLAEGKPATATLATDQGDITIELETKDAPNNSNSIAFLAEQGFFDNTPCHRLTTADLYVLQCGDPKGDGSGGPGYTTADENLPKQGKANYPAGTVAMAEPDGGEAGSQFFLVYKDTTLGANFTIVGQVTDGLEAVSQVAKAGVVGGGTDGAPATPITIKSVTVAQK